MSADPFSDRPKLLGDAEARSARQAQLRESHIAPLTAFVEALRGEVGPLAAIPYFDPWDGGIDAEVLFLLEAPGPNAVRTGFVSCNNPDETAKNFFELSRDAAIPRKRTVTWNIVPWYIGDGTKIRSADRRDTDAGGRTLPRLLDLLPRVNTVALIGQKAARASSVIAQLRPRIRMFNCPHPSPLFVNNAPGNRERILKVLREVANHLKIKEDRPF